MQNQYMCRQFGVEEGWYKIEFRIAIDMASFRYHIYMLYHVRDAKRVVVEAAKSW